MKQQELGQTPEHADLGELREEQLRLEVDALKRQLELVAPHGAAGIPPLHQPARTTLVLLLALLLIVLVAGFVGGYLPRLQRDIAVAGESRENSGALPLVNVIRAQQAEADEVLELPASLQPVTEAPVLARSDGYLKRRMADIGDHVTAGQLLGEIEAPELDQQVAQARASAEQSRAATEQAAAALQQARATEQLSRVTAERWRNLLQKGAVPRQENDQFQAQYQAQAANVRALENAEAASHSGLAAAEANVQRLLQMQSYKQVRAPFAGVITVRNVDTGALISAGQTLLYRIAQMGTVRAYINVPQAQAEAVRPGQRADVSVAEMQGQVFAGRVARTAEALDPTSRTLLVDVQVPNPAGKLMPGMYATVRVTLHRANPPVIVPGDAVVVRSRGPEVAVVENGLVHYRRFSIGRDYGDRMEALAGIRAGELLIANPGDAAKEGARVEVRELPGGARK